MRILLGIFLWSVAIGWLIFIDWRYAACAGLLTWGSIMVGIENTLRILQIHEDAYESMYERQDSKTKRAYVQGRIDAVRHLREKLT